MGEARYPPDLAQRLALLAEHQDLRQQGLVDLTPLSPDAEEMSKLLDFRAVECPAQELSPYPFGMDASLRHVSQLTGRQRDVARQSVKERAGLHCLRRRLSSLFVSNGCDHLPLMVTSSTCREWQQRRPPSSRPRATSRRSARSRFCAGPTSVVCGR